jgi:protein-S-isoprenylcysteine O-methyltransferase Ste14
VALFLIFLTAYCILHSVLADAYILRRVYFKWWYRFFYVAQSILLFIPLFLMYHFLPSEPLFVPNTAMYVFYALSWITGLGFGLYAVKSYDNGTFLGITQVKMKLKGTEYKYHKPKLTRRGALAYVRHPYYSVSLLLIWARPLAVKDLYLNTALTVYFILGIINEERKLRKEFGQEYIEYSREVPALIPFSKGSFK